MKLKDNSKDKVFFVSEMSNLFCTIRRQWVSALPEELVRQRFLSYMIEKKGFPISLVSVETPLKQLPHLLAQDRAAVPDRRADVLCYANGPLGLYPLLLVECKAVKLTDKVVSQVAGYNHYVRARYIAIVNESEIRFGWFDEAMREYVFINHLPSYQELNSNPTCAPKSRMNIAELGK